MSSDPYHRAIWTHMFRDTTGRPAKSDRPTWEFDRSSDKGEPVSGRALFREITDADQSFEHEVLYGALGSDVVHSGPFSLLTRLQRPMGNRDTFVLEPMPAPDLCSLALATSNAAMLLVLDSFTEYLGLDLSDELGQLSERPGKSLRFGRRDRQMTDEPMPFTEDELTAAAGVPMTDEILYHALRTGTQALSEFGYTVMEPVFRSQLALTDRESAIGTTFYRLLAAVRTLSDLRQAYQFQATSGETRLIFELCVDIHLLAKNKIVDAVEKFHGFTRAARFSAAYKTVQFYKLHPDLEDPGDAEERRKLVETPGKKDEIEALCQKLWGLHKAPEHWSGLRWSQQLELLDPEIQEWYIQWSALHAWLIHGGGAGVGGLSARSFRSIEVLCREKVKALVPEAYRLVAVEMHLHKALPNFFDELHRVRDRVEIYAAVDAQLQSLGRLSKLVVDR